MPNTKAIDAALGSLWEQARNRQAKQRSGCYLQCLPSHTNVPQDGKAVACDRAAAKPAYQTKGWGDLGGLPKELPFSVRIDQYLGPRGAGFVLVAQFVDGKDLWQRVLHQGPEDGWEQDWQQVEED